jgi:hypothetical protein
MYRAIVLTRTGKVAQATMTEILRRYEIQVAYDTAFLYLGTRGVVAEKWGHGPYFQAWSEQPGQITLTQTADATSQLSGVLGIRISLVVWQKPKSRESASQLSCEFLSDCVKAFQPQNIRSVGVKLHYISPTEQPQVLNAKLLEEHPTLAQIIPPGHETTYSGLMFNAELHDRDDQIRSSCNLGIYPKEASQQYFGYEDEDDPQWAMGCFIEYHRTGIWSTSRKLDLEAISRDANIEADRILGTTLRRYTDA